MQTFLPYRDFDKSAKCLDDKRLGKQRVECLQILKAIFIEDYGWQNHPAVKMWREHPLALQKYMNACIREWKSRGFKNTMSLGDEVDDCPMPKWLGVEEIHSSHRSNLIRKDKSFYSKYNWEEDDSLPYYWGGYSKQDNINYSHMEKK